MTDRKPTVAEHEALHARIPAQRGEPAHQRESRPGNRAQRGGGQRPRAHRQPAETRESFRIIDDQADRMIGLIAGLLDAGRIETGSLSVSPEASEVGTLVDQARNTFVGGGGRHAVVDRPSARPADRAGGPPALPANSRKRPPIRQAGALGELIGRTMTYRLNLRYV